MNVTVMFFVKTSDPVQNLKKSLRYSASSISLTSFLTCEVRTTSSCVQNQNNNHNFIYLNHMYINALFTHDWLLYSVDRETPANTSLVAIAEVPIGGSRVPPLDHLKFSIFVSYFFVGVRVL